jgi:cobalt transporter subunit CbtB
MLAVENTGVVALQPGTRIATAIFSMLFGACLLYFAGFAQSGVLHNAAHDTRHAIAAPCH